MSIYNLFNTNADATQYAYTYQVSPRGAGDGCDVSSAGTASARLTLTAFF